MIDSMQRQTRRGFTLMELLVVLAIVGLLAAILFAVFSGVREKGRQATCASNLKQIGIAFGLYADDNAQILPPGATQDAHRSLLIWSQVVSPYIKTSEIFLCPSDASTQRQPTGQEVSYGYNSEIGGVLGLMAKGCGPRCNPTTQSQILRPSATLLMADSGTTATEGLPWSQWPVLDPAPSSIGDAFTHLLTKPVTAAAPAPNARHQGRAEVLWADGHVSALPIPAFYNAPEHKRPQDKFTGTSPCFRPDMGCD